MTTAALTFTPPTIRTSLRDGAGRRALDGRMRRFSNLSNARCRRRSSTDKASVRSPTTILCLASIGNVTASEARDDELHQTLAPASGQRCASIMTRLMVQLSNRPTTPPPRYARVRGRSDHAHDPVLINHGDEANETFSVNEQRLRQPSGCRRDRHHHRRRQPANVTITDATVTEATPCTVSHFNVSLSRASGQTVTVTYSTATAPRPRRAITRRSATPC
jgi:hypothetical protein